MLLGNMIINTLFMLLELNPEESSKIVKSDSIVCIISMILIGIYVMLDGVLSADYKCKFFKNVGPKRSQ